ncbi:hypothetical protein PSACC_02006 [Paramicrosporidium saccamoebae]|uniref:Uncharacterized protein n=1 Tax=Paramicrosporidium saccamoebae TaxID=1246581 RepID=A0A2H9TKB0_9FUNG|nr:hypothetical protein PSACC_02006 [Paramicrosporidium saccamoebae]
MEHAMATQAENMQSFAWINELLGPNPTEDMALQIFEMFELQNVTPELMYLLVRVGQGEKVLNAYFSKLQELPMFDRIVGLITTTEVPEDTLASEGAQVLKKTFVRNLNMALDECWDTLIRNYNKSSDRSYWSLMAKMALRAWREDRDREMLCWVAELIPKDGLYNWAMPELISECGNACEDFVNRLVAITPSTFKPLSLVPLEDCRQTWLLESPFYIDTYLIDIEDMLTVSRAISEARILPLNWTFQGKPIGRAIIDNAKSLIDGEGTLRVDEVVQMLQSWPYLIREKEKLDFSLIFPTAETPKKWHVWATRLSSNNLAAVHVLRAELKSLGISGSLTPKDVRRMVDSSYQWCEEADHVTSTIY